MHIYKHKETGELGFHGNRVDDNIDWAAIHPMHSVFALNSRDDYVAIVAHLAVLEQYVSKSAGTYDDGREHPDLYSDRLRGNKIDVLPDGTVQLLNPDGTVASTLMATCQ